jgi:hypothetical protein
MLDHLCLRIPAAQFTEVVKFYATVLAPLGFKQLVDNPTFVGFGVDKPYFSLVPTGESAGNIHFAFTAESEFTPPVL